MPIEIRGHFIVSPFTFVCDGKLYRSSNSTRWTNIQDQFGYSVFGRYQHGWRVRNVPCPANRNHELTRAFHAALIRQTGHTGRELDAFIQNHIDKGNQVLVEGMSVKIYNGKTTVKVAGFSSTETQTPAPKETSLEVKNGAYIAYLKYGVPEDRLDEFHEWYRKRTGTFSGIKLVNIIKAWQGLVTVPPGPKPETVPAPEVAVTPEPKAPPKRKKTLIEEREHKENVPFYGLRRRNQAQFRADVELNCYGRCVITGASAIRCEAAHLIPHARKGGASFKNGLLLRSDLHKLFDLGEMAINPENLIVNFTPAVLAMDADLWRLQGMMIRPTDKPIRGENLQERWELFCAVNQ